MEITEVRIKLTGDRSEKLIGFCSITFDGEFVVRDIKIIQGKNGPFVAMPSRKLTQKCTRCHGKNEIRARYCSNCGTQLPDSNSNNHVDRGQARYFADIAHPVNARCRQKIHDAILTALETEKVKSQQPDYVCTYDDYDEFYSPSADG